MNDNLIIWGAGAWGSVAYYYYKDKGNILCYIDSDQRKWGSRLNGIVVCSPDILREKEAKLILAVKNGINNIKTQLHEQYGINVWTCFKLEEHVCSLKNSDTNELNKIEENSCIVRFQGGLGNQMFHYAVLKNLEVKGLNVLADLDAYKDTGVMSFCLTDIFKNIKLKISTKEQERILIEENIKCQSKEKKFLVYSETNKYEGKIKKADLSILDITGGIIYGSNQTHIYADRIRKELTKDFKFDVEADNKLEKICKGILERNAVSVHIRRGDYLSERNKWIYGDICTREYYYKAMQYMEERIGKCDFVFFSDDISWVKENFYVKNAIYIEEQMFEKYCDWYDMCLMSICRHNIIANSTFSWWGAWLNQNNGKIVIAPKRWINSCEYEDIYPKNWITI